MHPKSNGARWSIIVLLMALAGLAHFNRIAISVAGAEVFIGESQADAGSESSPSAFSGKGCISETRMGWVYTTFLIVYTLGMIPGGWLIDRIGAVRSLTMLGLAMGTFAGLTGALGWIAHSPSQLWVGLLVIRGIAGFFNTPLHPGAAHVVSDAMPPERQATANGLVTAGALIGIAFCYPVFGQLIDRIGWPWAFLVSGAVLAAFGIVWSLSASRLSRTDAASATTSHNTSKRNRFADWSILKRRDLWLISISYAAYGYFQYLFFYWMDYYFKNVLHIDKMLARDYSFWIILAQGFGMVLGGLWSDAICGRIGVGAGRRLVVMMGMGIGAGAALVAVSVQSEMSVVSALAVSMGALGMCEGAFWTTATDIGGPHRGLVAAFMNAFSNAGGLVSPTLTPMLAQSSLGWSGAITVACAIVAAGGFLWCWIRPLPSGVADGENRAETESPSKNWN